MGAIADIRTALEAKAALLTDALSKAECSAFIDEYIALRTAILALSSATVSSYSIAGRNVTRADLPRLRHEADVVRGEINLLASGDNSNLVAIGDMSGMHY